LATKATERPSLSDIGTRAAQKRQANGFHFLQVGGTSMVFISHNVKVYFQQEWTNVHKTASL
jgi:hypothetical protein